MQKLTLLKSVFGHDGFREGQEKMIDELLGGYDVLGVMPTGAGKSICYQLPALMMSGVTLVISPLISLMKDQVMALKASGVAGAYINSSLTPGQQVEAIRRAGNGAYKIIYVAPERLLTPAFLHFAQNTEISMIAVDEAHCVSQWGQDFRPSYLHIADFIRRLPKRPPVAAFTATATARVREDIIRLLELIEPYQLLTGFNRPNLRFTSIKPRSKFSALCSFLEGMDDACGIVYCSTRKNVEEVTRKLQEMGYRATRYHAGLTDEERRGNQDAFQYDRAQIMVATNAFGMGIDKSNVRFVVHYNMPRNLESYYQEAGRAGRDGEPAECLLLYSGQDVITGKWMIEHSEENDELSPQQREAVMKLELERLREMTIYATSRSCLRHFILNYFGEEDAPERCDNCSVCLDVPFESDTEHSSERKRSAGSYYSRENTGLNAWQRALLENLKILRRLLAAEQKAPAYTIFSDAALHDMVRKLPKTLDDFLDVSGVGVSKQKKYGQVFLSVLRDGKEPNEAMESYSEQKRLAQNKDQRENKGERWSDEEEDRLREEYFAEIPIREIAKAHGRTSGSIRARLQKIGLIE